ncbi:MAG: hypothetical protein RM338_20685 [Nostoc sp. DedQUE12a]|nr:hypothetical protein [Nostoc sp. DedQUE12a]
MGHWALESGYKPRLHKQPFSSRRYANGNAKGQTWVSNDLARLGGDLARLRGDLARLRSGVVKV